MWLHSQYMLRFRSAADAARQAPQAIGIVARPTSQLAATSISVQPLDFLHIATKIGTPSRGPIRGRGSRG